MERTGISMKGQSKWTEERKTEKERKFERRETRQKGEGELEGRGVQERKYEDRNERLKLLF
jgi:hypothetical protein